MASYFGFVDADEEDSKHLMDLRVGPDRELGRMHTYTQSIVGDFERVVKTGRRLVLGVRDKAFLELFEDWVFRALVDNRYDLTCVATGRAFARSVSSGRQLMVPHIALMAIQYGMCRYIELGRQGLRDNLHKLTDATVKLVNVPGQTKREEMKKMSEMEMLRFLIDTWVSAEGRVFLEESNQWLITHVMMASVVSVLFGQEDGNAFADGMDVMNRMTCLLVYVWYMKRVGKLMSVFSGEVGEWVEEKLVDAQAAKLRRVLVKELSCLSENVTMNCPNVINLTWRMPFGVRLYRALTEGSFCKNVGLLDMVKNYCGTSFAGMGTEEMKAYYVAPRDAGRITPYVESKEWGLMTEEDQDLMLLLAFGESLKTCNDGCEAFYDFVFATPTFDAPKSMAWMQYPDRWGRVPMLLCLGAGDWLVLNSSVGHYYRGSALCALYLWIMYCARSRDCALRLPDSVMAEFNL